MMPAVFLALLVSAPFPAGRYCVTPLGGNATSGLYVVDVVIDVAPEKAVGAKGAIITLRFKTTAAAKTGARGACWKLKAAPLTEPRANVYLVEAFMP